MKDELCVQNSRHGRIDVRRKLSGQIGVLARGLLQASSHKLLKRWGLEKKKPVEAWRILGEAGRAMHVEEIPQKERW